MSDAKDFVEWVNREVEKARETKGDEHADSMLEEMKRMQLRSYVLDQAWIILKQRHIAHLQEEIERIRRGRPNTAEILKEFGVSVNPGFYDRLVREFLKSDPGQYLHLRPTGYELDRAFDEYLDSLKKQAKDEKDE